MAWNEIIIEAEKEVAESLSDAFLDVGAVSVSVEDADEGTISEAPMFGEPGMEPTETSWNRSRLLALLPEGDDYAVLVAEVAKACGLVEVPAFKVREVADQDWVTLTQSQFDPILVGNNIWVVPSWHDVPNEDALVLELDPGLAFGTGSHPTTRLCMEWLELHEVKLKQVLDYGCGSGILAIVAKKLGAQDVVGVDVDPQAVDSAINNSARNHCDIMFSLPDAFQAKKGDAVYDIVVANILSNPLKVLAPMLVSRVAPGGKLVLSGILERQAQEMIEAYAPLIPLEVWRTSEGWVALAGTLPDGA